MAARPGGRASGYDFRNGRWRFERIRHFRSAIRRLIGRRRVAGGQGHRHCCGGGLRPSGKCRLECAIPCNNRVDTLSAPAGACRGASGRFRRGAPPHRFDSVRLLRMCPRARHDRSSGEKKPDAAAFWFASAIRQAPSIPFAYADWGEMLLRAGKYDAAIAKFKEANPKARTSPIRWRCGARR